MFYPKLDDVKSMAKDYNVIPISMEFHADTETPISIFKRFSNDKYCFLLESVEGGEKWARYSFIGRNPFIVFNSSKKKNVIKYECGKIKEIQGNPIYALKDLMEKYRGADIAGIPRFYGGAVGFFSYDTVRYFENLPNHAPDDIGLPESHFMLTNEVVVFDHLRQKIKIIVNLHVDMNIDRGYNTAIQRIKDIYEEIVSSRWKVDVDIKQKSRKKNSLLLKSSTSKEMYCKCVDNAKKYIQNGDIFQVVLSQRLYTKTNVDPFNVYRILRVINPSPYMYYLKFDDYSLVGSSPEMMVRVEGDTVETCPIAGTRKRGATKEEDEKLMKELLSDEKELAEHTMLVDLARNDIGKVCKFGTVVVNKVMHVEKYSHVMHIVSNVKGELQESKTPFEVLVSVLPAGTLSGAPKVRAMEIIDELETVKRGVYGGVVGYLSFNGNLDSCITIRTIVFKDKKAYIQAGAGIVADSVPEREYDESINKAKALINAIERAGEVG